MSDLALPTQHAPRQIAAAAATYAERLADLRRAVAAESSAEAGIAEAKRLAVLALVDARDAGSRKDRARARAARPGRARPRLAQRPGRATALRPCPRCAARRGLGARQRVGAAAGARARGPMRRQGSGAR
jgi:hypothetical protein